MSAIPAGAIARAAEAMAAERARSLGRPQSQPVLDILPEKLRLEVMREATAALAAAGFGDLLEEVRDTAEYFEWHDSRAHRRLLALIAKIERP